MQFVTGGAFNGKSRWVREAYSIEKDSSNWISAYQGDHLPIIISSNILVLEGIEVWVKEWIPVYGEETRDKWNQLLGGLQEWENEQDIRSLILIGTDITKGIVPMEKDNRIWRDVTGWIYQDIADKAEHVDLIWYGINKRLK